MTMREYLSPRAQTESPYRKILRCAQDDKIRTVCPVESMSATYRSRTAACRLRLPTPLQPLPLLEEHHLLQRLELQQTRRRVFDAQVVEVNSGRQPGCVDCHFLRPALHLLVLEKRHDLLPDRVEYAEGDERRAAQFEIDRRGRVERVWIILTENEITRRCIHRDLRPDGRSGRLRRLSRGEEK